MSAHIDNCDLQNITLTSPSPTNITTNLTLSSDNDDEDESAPLLTSKPEKSPSTCEDEQKSQLTNRNIAKTLPNTQFTTTSSPTTASVPQTPTEETNIPKKGGNSDKKSRKQVESTDSSDDSDSESDSDTKEPRKCSKKGPKSRKSEKDEDRELLENMSDEMKLLQLVLVFILFVFLFQWFMSAFDRKPMLTDDQLVEQYMSNNSICPPGMTCSY